MTGNERLSLIYRGLKEAKMVRNQAHFAELIGESSTGNLSMYLSGKKALGDKVEDFALHLSEAIPSLDLDWLLTGEGAMLRSVEVLPRITEGVGRPYYDIDFLGGYGDFLDDPASAPMAYLIDYPPYNREGVFYTNIVGDSMAPEFNSGDVVALRAIESWHDFLLLGKVYAIVTRSGQRTIKRLRRGSDSGHYLLVPANPAYESQEIPLAQIERVFEVLGGIRRYE